MTELADAVENFKRFSPLESIQIVGLFETETLTMTFPNAYTVFVADNGSGKTTGLYILQNILRRDFPALLRHKFEKLVITFRDTEAISIPYSGLVPRQFDSILRRVIGAPGLRLSNETMHGLLNLVATNTYEEARNDPEFRKLATVSRYPGRVIYDRFRNLIRQEVLRDEDLLSLKDAPSDIRHLHELLVKHFPMQVVYLPTYRRIEQDLKSFLNVEAEPGLLVWVYSLRDAGRNSKDSKYYWKDQGSFCRIVRDNKRANARPINREY